MESSASHERFSRFFLLLLFLLLRSVSSSMGDDYAQRPDKYYINCGSDSSSALNGQNYTGDLQKRWGQPVKDYPGSSNTTELYQTAWVFKKSSPYEFDIDIDGTYVVRFHFFPFQAMGKLEYASFDVVAASGFRLLSDFSAGVNNSDNSALPLVEEFLLTVSVGKLSIKFNPHNSSCFAFVNAMEVFMAPPDFISDRPTSTSNEQGEDARWSSNPLRVMHRINVGGSAVARDADRLLRFWVPDDEFLYSKVNAKNSTPYAGQIKYGDGRNTVTRFIAPDDVYSTAKQMNTQGTRNNLFNVSWRFDVRSRTRHYVRVHFCDIVSNLSYYDLKFYLFMDGKFRQTISPPPFATPFFSDYSVDSDDSGILKVGIGPPGSSSDGTPTTAFLNGIEIMELVDSRDSSSDGTTRKKHLLVIVIASSLGGGFVLVLILSAVLFCFCKRRKWKKPFGKPPNGGGGGSSYTHTIDRTQNTSSPLANLNLGLKITLNEILYATKNFDSKLMIGQGGFGKVYRGILKNGTKVAVKRSEPGKGQGLAEFETEITVLSKIRHQHLVSLIGYCNERGEMILVYEFMEKGTLRDHLYAGGDLQQGSSPKLSWEQRLGICIGAAKGLVYLHRGSDGSIIHRDIKSTNILLDENYVAKVADFGLSKLEHLGEDSYVVTGVKGTYGYLDPEYYRFNQLTRKSDVYSFGALLLEVLCGRPVIDHSLPEDRTSLIEWAMSWLRKGKIESVVDGLMAGTIDSDCLRKYGELVAKCLQEEGSERPDMIDVLWDLEYCLKLQRGRGGGGVSYDTDVSLDLSAGLIGRLPSRSMTIDEDDDGNSSLTPDDVFSQLKIDQPR